MPPRRRPPALGSAYFRKNEFVAQVRPKWRGAETQRAEGPTSALWLMHQVPQVLSACSEVREGGGQCLRPGRPQLLPVTVQRGQ